jgi:hypothetical protein
MSKKTAGAGEKVTVGYARIQYQPGVPAPAGIAIFNLRTKGVVVSEAAVPAAPLVRTARLFAENGTVVRTGLSIANPNAQAATLSFNFTDETGTDFGAGSFLIPANAHISAFLDETLFASAAPHGALSSARSFTFTSTAPVAAIALRGLVNERGDFLMTTLPVADLSQISFETTIIPHFAQGGGWTTQVPLLNPTGSLLAGTVEFIDPAGTTIDTQRYSIAGSSAAVIRMSSGGPVLRTGWIRIRPDGTQASPVGVSIFSFIANGVTVTESGIQALPASARMRMYVENSGVLQSALALANNNLQAVTLNVQVTDTTGRDIGLTGTITLPGRGQKSVFVNEVPGLELLPSNFAGLVRITTSGPAVSVIGLRGRYNERGDFLIAATAPVQETPPAAGELFFPHVADGGGFSTEFILFNSSTGLFGEPTTAPPSAGTVRFYSQIGDPLTLGIR